MDELRPWLQPRIWAKMKEGEKSVRKNILEDEQFSEGYYIDEGGMVRHPLIDHIKSQKKSQDKDNGGKVVRPDQPSFFKPIHEEGS